MAQQDYIYTKHVLQRIKERRIPHDYVNQVIANPDKTTTRSDGSFEISKRIQDRTIEMIVKPNEGGEMIVISCWVNPPFPGTKDAKKRARYFEMQKASPMKKLWLTVLDQLGL